MDTKSKAVLTAIVEEQERKRNAKIFPVHAIAIDVAKGLLMPVQDVHDIAIVMESDGRISISPTLQSWGYSIKK